MQDIRPKVSIILLNYNGYEDTIDCFQSLQKVNYNNFEIVIVDNASPDQSMGKISAYMQDKRIEHILFEDPNTAMDNMLPKPKISLIQSGFNGGYGHGNNIGIKYALKNDADYVLILNNDTVVEPDFLEPLVMLCEEDENIGIASGKIYFHDRPDTLWFIGGSLNPYTAKITHFNFNEKDTGQIPKKPINFITGCMWLIPKKIFATIGFINEDYFMYVEDLEYCQRVINKSYTLGISENSRVFHKAGAASGGHLSDFSTYWISRNKIKFISANVKFPYKITAYIYNLFIMPLRWLYKRKVNSFFIHIKGTIDAIFKGAIDVIK